MSKPFPGNETIARVRKTRSGYNVNQKKTALLALVDWYNGMARSADQGGTVYDVDCNVRYWRRNLTSGIDDEQAELLNLSYLASRQTMGLEGYWQALTFERHAKIILGVGSVAGNRLGIPTGGSCVPTT